MCGLRPFHPSCKIFFADWLSKGILEGVILLNKSRLELSGVSCLGNPIFSMGHHILVLFKDLLLLDGVLEDGVFLLLCNGFDLMIC